MRSAQADERLETIATVNGEERRFSVAPRVSLADALRGELGLAGVRSGCEHGICGACTILVDGKAMRACLMLGIQAHGRDIRTVEGLGTAGQLAPLQEAFRRHHALQCGFCTSGMLASAQALLDENPAPTREEAREAMSGNLCRCTGYQTIIDAVMDEAARRIAERDGAIPSDTSPEAEKAHG